MQTIISQYLPELLALLAPLILAVKVAALPVAVWLAYQVFASLVSLAFARKTQVESWVSANPKRAFVLRVIRATGVDPWLILKAWKGLAESRPPTGVPSWIVRIVRKARGSLGLLSIMIVVGCAGNLEESRAKFAVTSVGPVALKARDNKRCEELSDRGELYNVVAVTSGALAPVLLTASFAVESSKWETGLQVASGTSGAISGGAAFGYSHASASYVSEGCGK